MADAGETTDTETRRRASDSEDVASGEDPLVGDLFGSESEEEPAASRVESAKTPEATESVMPERFRILQCQLEPPTVGFTEEGTVLPAEFELADPMELKFAAERVRHPSEAVSLFSPGELMDVDLQFFDESLANGFVENGTYQKRVMRWRKNEKGEIESNTKLVEWDDGSLSFYVEGKWYDLGKEAFAHGTELLCIDQQNCLQALHAVNTGMLPVSVPMEESDDDEAESHIVTKPVQSLRQPKTKKVTVLGNPVKEREAKLKKIQEDQRDRELMERRQRTLQEKYTLPSLEHLSEGEEEAHVPVKRTRPSRRQPARANKHRPMDSEDDFIAEDEEEEMESAEIEEEEAALGSEESDAETEKEEREEEMEASEGEEPVTSQNAAVEQKEDRKVTKGQRVILLTDEEDDDLSDD